MVVSRWSFGPAHFVASSSSPDSICQRLTTNDQRPATVYNSLHLRFHENSQPAVCAQGDRCSPRPYRAPAHEPRDRCRQRYEDRGRNRDEPVGSLAAHSATARVGSGCGWTSGDGLSTARGPRLAAAGDVGTVVEGHDLWRWSKQCQADPSLLQNRLDQFGGNAIRGGGQAGRQRISRRRTAGRAGTWCAHLAFGAADGDLLLGDPASGDAGFGCADFFAG